MADKKFGQELEARMIATEEIRHRIFSLRGCQVMMYSDLAKFYDVKPIRLKEKVKRNLGRFPPDFMFRLTKGEVEFMVSQIAIPSLQHLDGVMQYAFTEQGFAMLSAVQKSDIAVESVSIS